MARFTKEQTWRRWEGRRRDLTRVMEIASDALSEWSGYPSEVSIRITLEDALTERSDDPNVLEGLDTADLKRITELRIDVEPSRRAWREQLEEAQKAWLEREDSDEPPPDLDDLIEASVGIQFRTGAISAARLAVDGTERDRVEGLSSRLAEIIERGAGPRLLRLIPREAVWVVFGLPLIVAGLIAGPWLVRWAGTATRNDKYEAGEIVGMVSGLAVALGIVVLIFWMTPPLEVLDETRRPRSRRATGWLGAAVLTLALGIIGTAIYDAVS